MTPTARFELFSFWRTSATYRVRVAFNLKGVQPQEHNVNIDSGEQRSAAQNFCALIRWGACQSCSTMRQVSCTRR